MTTVVITENATADSVIVSVQHTGSRFLAERLGINKICIVHTYTELSQVVADIQGRRILSPIRHPQSVWESWCKRGRIDYATFMYSFFTLGALASIYPVDFIAVDKQQDSRISDWGKVCHDDREVKCPTVDLSPLKMIPFVREFYYDN